MPKPRTVRKKHPQAVQANVRYPTDLLERAARAAEWEGLSFSAYARSALLRRVRMTEAEQAAAGPSRH
jgi:hypothetical protein